MEHLNKSTSNYWVFPVEVMISAFMAGCTEDPLCSSADVQRVIVFNQTSCIKHAVVRGGQRPQRPQESQHRHARKPEERKKPRAESWIFKNSRIFFELRIFIRFLLLAKRVQQFWPELPQSRKSPAVNDPSERTWQSVDPVSSLSFLLRHRSGVCLPPVTSHPRRDLEVCSGTQSLRNLLPHQSCCIVSAVLQHIRGFHAKTCWTRKNQGVFMKHPERPREQRLG